MRKFVALWVEAMTEFGDQTRGVAIAHDLESARAKAIEGSRKAGVLEWIGVREDEWVGDKRDGQWETVNEWTGDYDVLEQRVSA